jgi:hypothetical protein
MLAASSSLSVSYFARDSKLMRLTMGGIFIFEYFVSCDGSPGVHSNISATSRITGIEIDSYKGFISYGIGRGGISKGGAFGIGLINDSPEHSKATSSIQVIEFPSLNCISSDVSVDLS